MFAAEDSKLVHLKKKRERKREGKKESKGEKQVPETFYLSLCGLEKLELIMRLLPLDSRGRGMLPVLKVSTVD